MTKTGGRPATTAVVPGRYALSVGKPDLPTPPGWEWTALTSVARLETGHTPSRKHPEYWDGDIPWIGIKDATTNHGFTIYDTFQHTNELGIANSSARLLPAQTVCLSRTASVGYVVVMGRPMSTSQDFVNWVCSNAIDHRFLKYVLVAEHETFPMFASGATHQTVYFPEVKAFHVKLPPLPTQFKIADILSAFDDLIANNTRRIEILEEIVRAIYREWFVEFRYPGHAAVPLVESKLGPLPDGWSAGELDDLLTLQRGFDLPTRDRQPGDVPVIAATGPHGFHDVAKVSGPGVVTGRSGTVGQVQLIHSDFWPLNTTLWVKEWKKATSPEFAASTLSSIDMSVYASGAAVPTLNRNHVARHPLPIPSDDVVVRFTDSVRPMLLLTEKLHLLNAGLARARDLLLPKLVSGELDVSNLDFDEVA